MTHGISNSGFRSAAIWQLFITMLLVCAFIVPQAFAFTVNVVDGKTGSPITGFRYLVEEDNTNQSGPGALVSDSLAVSIHNSHAPVVSSGASDSGSATIAVPDPAKRYVLSILPYTGYSIGGANIVNNQDVTVKVVPHTVPTAQVSILAFQDHNPINNAPDLIGFQGNIAGTEVGLPGFSVILSDAAGMVSQDAFANPLGTTYQTTQNGDFIKDGDGNPVVDTLGNGTIVTDADGYATVKYLVPNKYGVVLSKPDDGKTYIQTTTIEGTPLVDAWVGADNPELLVEFGPAFNHIFIGFVTPDELPGFRPLEQGEVFGTIEGQVVNNHLTKPPLLQGFTGHPVPDCLVALNELGGGGLIAQECNADSTFTFDNVPPGSYQLVTWDKSLDYIIGFFSVSVPSTGGVVKAGDPLTGEVPIFAWFNNLEGNVFFDDDGDGFRDIGEAGVFDQAVNLRYRDGTIYQATTTDLSGDYSFNEVFPFFHWLVTEVDFARFKATGATIAVDDGGEITSVPGEWPGNGKMTPQEQDPSDTEANAYGDTQYRTEKGVVLTEAYFGFAGQTNIIDWGKAIYGPGADDTYGTLDDENGGITGIVFYAVTVAENDPRYAAAEGWEPGIPRAQVNLYEDFNTDGVIDDQNGGGVMLADVDNYPLGWTVSPGSIGPEDIDRDSNGVFDMHDAIAVTWTDSWDDSKPTDCPQPPIEVHGQPVPPCYDNFSTWNQVRPGIFDGGYAFGPAAGAGAPSLPSGEYIVEAATPPGYQPLREEHKNVDFGDVWTPSLQSLPPACVGDGHIVPQYLSFQTDAAGDPLPGIDGADLIEAPYAGTTRPGCDRKTIYLTGGKNAAVDFFAITPIPKAARGVGFINNDLGAENNPFSPVFGEKQTPAWIPVSFKDYLGNEVVRVYADEFGAYNALLPSTYTINVPDPTGVSSNMYTICLNDAGPIADPDNPGQMITDPFFDLSYSSTCYTFNFEPGKTIYLDTPVIQVAAFVGDPNRTLDVQLDDGIPVIASVDSAFGGPLVCAPGDNITIYSLGQTEVPNPNYDPDASPPDPNAETLVTRDYGFGLVEGAVMVNGSPLDIVSWSDAVIVATNVTATGQLDITRGDNGNTTVTGTTLHFGTCAPREVVNVSSGESIQAAIDTAPLGALILVEPGTYNENLVLWRNVRLQGSGADSTIINALPIPYTRVPAWKNYVQNLLDTGAAELLPGQDVNSILHVDTAPGILVLGKDDTFDAANPGLIDGFTIQGANSGGGIYVNAYGDYLTISNNKIVNNQGNHGGGIHIGNPGLDSFNDNITIQYNQILQNGGINGGSGISYFTGSDNLVVYYNQIGGNFTRSNGGAISHNGTSDNVYIGYNEITFNEVFYGGEVGGNGGGIFISGEPALAGAGATPGAGNVTIEANLIQGNLAGSGLGGGIAVESFNGTDGTYTLNVFDNIIVNNIAAYAGGGIAVQDAFNANIINNTVAHNDSTATSVEANVGLSQSTPQVAGIVVGNAIPTLKNNIIYENRSFYRDATLDSVPGQPELGLGRLVPASSHPSGLYLGDYWDIGVLGIVGIADPDYSLLATLSGTMGGMLFDYNDGTNVTGDPLFVAPYFNELSSGQAGDEGGNFVNIFPSPLTTEGSDYHITGGSPAVEIGTPVAFPELATDYDGDARPSDTGVDIGADEVPGATTVLRVLTPNGGRSLFGGTSTYILWSPHPSATTYDVKLSFNGTDFWTIASGVAGTSYAWTVPNSNASTAVVRIVARNGAAWIGADDSDASFTIIKGGTVLSPDGGEIFTGGTVQNIQWTPHPNATNYDIKLSYNGGVSFWKIASGVADTNYAWTIPSNNVSTAMIRVVSRNSASWVGADDSNDTFTIVKP